MDKIISFKQKIYINYSTFLHSNILKYILELLFIIILTIMFIIFTLLLISSLSINIDIINKILFIIIIIIEMIIGIIIVQHLIGEYNGFHYIKNHKK